MVADWSMFIAVVIGSCLLGHEYGWVTGLGIGLIAWALTPFSGRYN